MKECFGKKLSSCLGYFLRFAAVVFLVVLAVIVIVHFHIGLPSFHFFGGGSNTVISADAELAVSDFCSAELAVCFISIGQADSILIKQAENTMLIDCGESDDAQEILKNLKILGVKSIDNLILTHPHSDHIGGSEKIIRNIEIEKLYIPHKRSNTVSFEKMLDAILDENIEAVETFAGMDIPFGEVTITVLSPVKDTEYENLNGYSIVLLLEYNGVKMLFCGDAEAENEDMILSSGYDIDCDLVKIPHHGSKSSSTAPFIDAVSADLAIATTEYNSEDGLPKKEIISRWESSGANVFCTHDCGNIYVLVNDGVITVHTELSHSDNN